MFSLFKKSNPLNVVITDTVPKEFSDEEDLRYNSFHSSNQFGR